MNLDADSPNREDGDVAQPVATGEDGLPEQTAEKGKRRAAKSSKKPRTLFGTVVEILVIVAAAFAIAMLVQLFLIKPFLHRYDDHLQSIMLEYREETFIQRDHIGSGKQDGIH